MNVRRQLILKNLVIYYSRTGENYVNGKVKTIDKGNTEYIAEFIGDNFEADLFRVETKKEYSKSYMDCIREAQKELNHDDRPQLKSYLEDISTYDNIFIEDQIGGVHILWQFSQQLKILILMIKRFFLL